MQRVAHMPCLHKVFINQFPLSKQKCNRTPTVLLTSEFFGSLKRREIICRKSFSKSIAVHLHQGTDLISSMKNTRQNYSGYVSSWILHSSLLLGPQSPLLRPYWHQFSPGYHTKVCKSLSCTRIFR